MDSSLTLGEKRKAQKQHIMGLVKSLGPHLASLQDVMANASKQARTTPFQVLDTRGLFTDGWLMPIGPCATAPRLHKFLRESHLDVLMPAPSKRKDHLFVHLVDGDHILASVLEKL